MLNEEEIKNLENKRIFSIRGILIIIWNDLILILIFLAIALLFERALSDFSYFSDREVTTAIVEQRAMKFLDDYREGTHMDILNRFYKLLAYEYIGKLIGLLIVIVFSLILFIRKKLSKLNSLLIFILGFLIIRFKLDSFTRFLDIYFLIHIRSWEVLHIINGCLLLIMGIAALWLVNKNILKWRISK